MLTTLFVMFLLASVLTQLWLASRQVRHVVQHRQAVPAEFSSRISLSSHQRAADYTVARMRLGMLERITDAVILVGLTLLGGLEAIQQLVGAVTQHELLRQVLLILSVSVLLGVLSLPYGLSTVFPGGTLWVQPHDASLVYQ